MKLKHKSTTMVGFAMLVLFLNSCATYTMTPEQLYSQIHDATPRRVTTEHPMSVRSQRYVSNGVTEIVCTDKHGYEESFENSPKVEVRITDTRNHKHYFYFDTMLLEDSTFTGMNSRIFATRISIRYADIKKVEVQKGAKAYSYK